MERKHQTWITRPTKFSFKSKGETNTQTNKKTERIHCQTSPLRNIKRYSLWRRKLYRSWTQIYIIKGRVRETESVSHSAAPDSLWPHGLEAASLLRPWNSPGKITGVGSHFLLQGIFPTQGWNLGLLHCRQTLYCLSHKGRTKGRIQDMKFLNVRWFLFYLFLTDLNYTICLN